MTASEKKFLNFDAPHFLKTCPTQPGVYRMFDEKGEILYIGKAKQLKNRLSSYFQKNLQSPKTKVLVSHLRHIEVTVTKSETEALLLEQQLIKSLKPRYNILFKDDKSYPYLYLSAHPEYPRLGFYRGVVQGKEGNYFGPYTSAGAARQSLHLLEKIFKLRSCEDSFFKNRTRPCLQYQIKRCTAPCVKFIDAETYAEDVRHARLFLQGKNQEVIQELMKNMEAASEDLNFEKAASFRDQIALLRRIQEQQYIMTAGEGDADVIGYAISSSAVCVLLLLVRQGTVIGQDTYFPKNIKDAAPQEIIEEFISQHYFSEKNQKTIPHEIIVPMALEEKAWLSEGLTQVAQHGVKILTRVQEKKQHWLALASENAIRALEAYEADKQNIFQRFQDMTERLGLLEMPERIECFDISHTQGESTVASCVVFTREGPLKREYRQFNITGIKPGDDYAAMYQVLLRRYGSLKEKEGVFPDLIIIDGGKGQLTQAEEVLKTLGLFDIQLLGVAKGPSRKAGLEQLFLHHGEAPLRLDPHASGLHLIQWIRDEAHRFAIAGHRQRRGKKRKISPLESIPGVGAKRRRELLRYFGGLQALQNASPEEIAKTPGISASLAETIWQALHST